MVLAEQAGSIERSMLELASDQTDAAVNGSHAA